MVRDKFTGKRMRIYRKQEEKKHLRRDALEKTTTFLFPGTKIVKTSAREKVPPQGTFTAYNRRRVVVPS